MFSGGWANPLIADWFSDYARVAFSLFANRVKIWLTINEPLFVCDYVYNGEPLVPMVEEKEIGPYLCNKNVLLAHAKAWRIYDEEFKPEYHGIFIFLACFVIFYKLLVCSNIYHLCII